MAAKGTGYQAAQPTLTNLTGKLVRLAYKPQTLDAFEATNSSSSSSSTANPQRWSDT
jgi:hypothetical protein